MLEVYSEKNQIILIKNLKQNTLSKKEQREQQKNAEKTAQNFECYKIYTTFWPLMLSLYHDFKLLPNTDSLTGQNPYKMSKNL